MCVRESGMEACIWSRARNFDTVVICAIRCQGTKKKKNTRAHRGNNNQKHYFINAHCARYVRANIAAFLRLGRSF